MTKKNKKDGLVAGDNSIVIGGNMMGSSIVIGDGNTISNQSVNVAPLFKTLEDVVDQNIEITSAQKEDIKAELQEVQAELEKPNPDESFLTRRFRNLKRMTPDIVDVAFETLKNPIGGVAEVVKRIAKKMAEDANA